MIRYHICGLCYDENDHIKDGEMYIDDFDTYEEAYEKFVKLQCQGANWFFEGAPGVYQMLIQSEECEEDDEEIRCINVRNEWWITNPNFKEELKMNKKNNMAYWDDIDALTEEYVRKLVEYSTKKDNLYGYEYTADDIEDMDDEERAEAREQGIIEVAKDITEFATELLEYHYGASFPYVDENY